MSSFRVVYQTVRADFLERARRYSFLLTLGFAAFLAYEASTGGIVLQLGGYRGVYNSAWVGGMMTLVSTCFLTLVGFYIVKNAVQRDEQTRVGQVLATTPMSRPFYTMAKALSNFVVLATMLAVLAVAAIALELLRSPQGHLAPGKLLAPFVWVGLPAVAVIAALAVLFETLPLLRSGAGNVIYFFVWAGILSSGIASPRFDDLLGLNLLGQGMEHTLKAVAPGYKGGLSLMVAGMRQPTKTFVWNGVDWTASVVFHRLLWVALAVGLAGLASFTFRRFDPAREPWRRKREKAASEGAEEEARNEDFASASTAETTLTPLAAGARERHPLRLVGAELLLMLKGHRWWWYAGAAGMIGASLVVPSDRVREGITLAAWLWPVLVWSQMGVRETRYNTESLIFSTQRSLFRQLPAVWVAGVVVALAVGAGMGLHLLLEGDWSGIPGWAAGIVFVPSLALTLGVWSGTSKPFEALYTVWWYVGPLHHMRGLDFTGMAHTPSSTWFYLLSTAALLTACYAGRRRKMGYA